LIAGIVTTQTVDKNIAGIVTTQTVDKNICVHDGGKITRSIKDVISNGIGDNSRTSHKDEDHKRWDRKASRLLIDSGDGR
jgi:hypothetical protein